ncbi:NAD-dependent epimerase/dehydratase family protein [Flavobacterium circumlabens]|uniref:NAD(P)-binding protein n=1 Tax=Flavobacterium circumlabens TaxID=2133765 RepID=A0A4Y7UCJ9_9FLAO|nr:NAD(P)H-binding protein [Flavobacterium circumlabens]TCN57635.1 putative NAD(P)-binding protein [Flavobacterium circumlabens]TEB43941.1 NAD-dependent epimerase/dehydratase family protein [Flavobacterium circumlabens]
MKALLIGATGSTGKFLLNELIQDDDYTSVTIFVRRTTGRSHPKLTEHVIDFSHPQQYSELISGDILFSCLGTTLKDAGSKEGQWKIDFEIPATFATIARKNRVSSMVLVSSSDASPSSRIFYSRMKGELETTISELDFGQYIIFRPGPLLREGTDRSGEKIIAKTLGFLNGIGLLKKYKPLPTEVLAMKLAKAPWKLPQGTSVVKLQEIEKF